MNDTSHIEKLLWWIALGIFMNIPKENIAFYFIIFLTAVMFLGKDIKGFFP